MSIESLPGRGGDNHFNLLRLIAASAVIVAHAYELSQGRDASDPLKRLTGFDLGTTAVIAFFAISGYFVYLSFDRRKSNTGFIVARVSRIYPGLLVVLLITAFVVGPFFTDIPLRAYFRQSSVWFYAPLNVLLFPAVEGVGLPGVFAHNPYPGAVNDSLWTLYFEAVCYVALFTAGVLGFLRRTRFIWLLIAWLCVYLAARFGSRATELQIYTLFSLPFVLGMAVYHYRALPILKGWIAVGLFVAALAFALAGEGVQELWSAAIGYGVLKLGFMPAPALLQYNRIGDFSYGTYIYGFPIEQMFATTISGIHPASLIGVSLPAAIACGALSWIYVERPSLMVRNLLDERSLRNLRLDSSPLTGQ